MADKANPVADPNRRDSLYERDYYSWALDQARVLQEKRVEELDWENLAEEVGDWGRSEARGLTSQLARLLAHLLKWQLQPRGRSNSGRGSIRGARNAIRELLDESPGLKRRLPELFEKAYRAGINLAVEETNLDESRFFPTAPWTFQQAMDDEFWPNSENLSSNKPIHRARKRTNKSL
jgi:hypothetical protein